MLILVAKLVFGKAARLPQHCEVIVNPLTKKPHCVSHQG